MRKGKGPDPRAFRFRLLCLFGVLTVAAGGLVARAVDLQLVHNDFLVGQGDQRYIREVETVAHRGMILDRNGEPLAVSTPVDSVSANPRVLAGVNDQWPLLAKALNKDRQDVARRIAGSQDRSFIYLARHMKPVDAQAVRKLGMPGVSVEREYRRYYPSGEVVGHVLGFTNVDDAGQEGAELAFDHWLSGEDGKKRVIQDRMGRKVEDVDSIRATRPGRDLTLSIDLRIQYLAYRELKAAIRDQRARSGSVVVIDVASGEVLAMVNQPTFNPNDRDQLTPGMYRNRAATDMLEPGSSIKPFVVAAALESGRYDEHSTLDASAGFLRVGSMIVEDEHSIGVAGLETILAKSSNVGMSMIALSLEPQQIWSTLRHLGFGQVTASGFPGESAGVLSNYANWRPISIATMSYGYGLSVTPLQLAHAYATLGAMGVARPVSMLRVDDPVEGERVLSEKSARTLVKLLEAVVSPVGTGKQAAIPGYRVAGKTGTAKKAMAGGYSSDHYVGVFGGVAPATNPRLAAVVVIDDPGAGHYYGGDVAAPVFSAVVGGALRLMGVAPDDIDASRQDPFLPTQTLVRR
jgi:cell division protein FtsI (penicillin-binding protein 3)